MKNSKTILFMVAIMMLATISSYAQSKFPVQHKTVKVNGLEIFY